MKSISMYSYKGGSGRSTACVNIIYFLAKQLNISEDHPIVIVDADIDSAGLSFLLNTTGEKPGLYLQDILSKGNPGENALYNVKTNPFFQSLLPVGEYFNFPKRSILLLPAKINDDNAFNLGPGECEKFKTIRKIARYSDCSALFYDCPAGTQLLAKWSIYDSDNIVCCLRPTYQFIKGTVESVIKTSSYINPRDKKKYILCPNAVSNKGGVFQNRRYPDTIRQVLQEEVVDVIKKRFEEQNITGHIIDDSMLNDTPDEYRQNRLPEFKDKKIVGIPEVERFKWVEACLGTLNEEYLSSDERLAVERYKYLVSLFK